MAIYYNILYPPLVPITHPAFELGKPTDTFRLFFEPAVGNKISDFKDAKRTKIKRCRN